MPWILNTGKFFFLEEMLHCWIEKWTLLWWEPSQGPCYCHFVSWAALHWPDRSGWSCWSAQWNATFRRIGSSGTSQSGDPNWSNMADALAMSWRRVSIQITTAVSNFLAKKDAIACEYDVILQKSTLLIPSPFLFWKYWYSGLSSVRMCSLYFMSETDWFFILFSRIGL